MSAIKDRVCKKLNAEFGKDVKNLAKCEELNRQYKQKKEELENMLSLVSSEVPSKVSEAAQSVDEACNSIKTSCCDVANLLEKIEKQNALTSKVVLSIKDNFDKIGDLERLLSYLLTLQRVEELSGIMELRLGENDMSAAVDFYELLSQLYGRLAHSKCTHMVKFMTDTLHYWNNILRTQLSEEFRIVMKGVQWPIVSSNNLLSAPQPDALTTFQAKVRHLLRIHLPGEDEKVVSSSLVVSFPTLSLPMSLLLQPLRKRFIYHFSSNRQTNRPDKPEWYFTQVLTWIRDHEMFVVKWVQPIFNQLGITRSAKVELMSGVVQLAVEKLEVELEQAQYDDCLFSHTVDEALAFDKELHDNYSYPPSLPSATSVLTHAHIFIKWIRMERKFARDKMDAALRSEMAWCRVSPEDRTTEAAHAFLAVFSAMTQRYSSLVQPGHKLQFVELQIELWDDLRVALLQVVASLRQDPLHSHLPDVLNTVAHLVNALEEWNASPAMLLLEHYKLQYGEEETGGDGIFGSSLSLLKRLSEQLLQELTDNVMLEVKARSRPYRRHTWHCMKASDLEGVVSESACPMFQALSDNLHLMETRLELQLFETLWQSVAKQLNTFLLEELVLENSFNVTGGDVLERDILRGLVPLFTQYTQLPHNYFTQLLEACSLLKLPHVPSMVRRAAVTGTNLEALYSLTLDLNQLSLHQIATVLKRRIDLSTIDVM